MEGLESDGSLKVLLLDCPLLSDTSCRKEHFENFVINFLKKITKLF